MLLENKETATLAAPLVRRGRTVNAILRAEQELIALLSAFVGIMFCAILTHLFLFPPVALALVPAFLGVVFGQILWGRWPQNGRLVDRLGRKVGSQAKRQRRSHLGR